MNLLVNPTSMVQNGYSPPPLGLLYLAAMDPETEIYDDALPGPGIEATLHAMGPKVVGVPIYTKGRHDSLDILRKAKACGMKTVAGGPHVAVMTKQLVEHYGDFVDHFVVSDGESAWRRICAGEDLPKVIKTPVDLNELPLPAWEKVDLHRYPARGWGVHRGNNLAAIPRVSIMLGRGCDGRCTFCSTWWVNGRYRSHEKSWMERHLRKLWDLGARHLVFQDDCLTADRNAILDLCDALKKFAFSWFGTTRVDRLDRELATEMVEAGCYELTFGIESGSQTILNRMRKDTDISRAFEARAICREFGIKFTALMIEGFPYHTEETAREDREFRARLQPDEWGSVGHTMVLPGTALYAACKRAGLIDDSFWLGPEPYYIYHGGLE